MSTLHAKFPADSSMTIATATMQIRTMRAGGRLRLAVPNSSPMLKSVMGPVGALEEAAGFATGSSSGLGDGSGIRALIVEVLIVEVGGRLGKGSWPGRFLT